jgi:hypothetical protein
MSPVGKAVELTIDFDATVERVWAVLADLGSHPEWMRDAGAIRFLSEQRSGVGTSFSVPTRIGPLRTEDVMTVTEWEEGKSIAARHEGAVSGVGRFELRSHESGTELRWNEALSFPWWLGGTAGAALAKPILRRVWRRNLERLRSRVEVNGP